MDDHTSGAVSMIRNVLDYNAWATDQLLSFSEPLPAEQLVATVPGVFGTVFETLHHFIESDGHYLCRVAPHLWPADLHTDANDAWEASLGGPAAFERVRATPPEDRVRARRAAFLSGDRLEAFGLLRSRAGAVADMWRTYADGDPDPSAVCKVPGSADGSTAAVQVAQAIGHSHEHREQVRLILTSLGLQPPDISGMAWGRASGLFRAPLPGRERQAPMSSPELVPVSSDADWERYHDIRERVLWEARGLFGTYDRDHPDERAEGNHPSLLVVDGTPVGAIRVDVRPPIAWFRRVAIREDLQRRGYGRSMLELAMEFAREQGCVEARSNVDPDAVPFYDRLGFTRVEGDAPGSSVPMGRRI